MTIKKGEAWGSRYAMTGSEPIAHTDAGALALIAAALDEGRVPDPVVLRGGDLYRMLGGRPADEPQRFPIDIVDVVADGHRFRAVGHVVARHALWAGRFVVVMNGQFVGEWNLGPRAHSNDGLLDITDGSLGVRDRLVARRRARSGSHLPHPSLATRRAATAEFDFDRPMRLFVDGLAAGECRTLALSVVPDAATVVI